jgi:hypothetical protein
MSCIEIAYQTLSSSGKILDDFDNESNTPALTSMQKSGFMNLNPVLVSIHFTPTESGTELHIQAYAKEGLIKQNSAMKCIATLKERITSQLKEF